MADILFVIKDPRQAVAGAIERIHVSVPFVRQRTDPNGVPLFDQLRRPIMMPDAAEAWKWVKSQGFYFPKDVSFTGIIRPYTPESLGQASGPPIVLTFQLSPPNTSGSFVNAGQPDAQMHGQSNGVEAPPQVGRPVHYGGPNGELRRADPWETVDGSGVPRTQDSVMGDADPQGGTFTDVSPFDDQEHQRSLDPKKVGDKPQLTPTIVWGFAIQWYADGYDLRTNKPRWNRIHPQQAYQQAHQRLKATGQYAE
jgi:hypothetical protein